MRGGRYAGEFLSLLTGTAEKPIVLRQYPGERATIDGRIDIQGRYAYYWGFEMMYSDPAARQRAGRLGPDRHAARADDAVHLPARSIVSSTVIAHDLGDGLFSGSSAEGLEIYGSLFYNNGWDGPANDRGHGHGLYLQNRTAAKKVSRQRHLQLVLDRVEDRRHGASFL